MIKAVIFDLDGVLVSTDELHYRAWKRLAEELGITRFTREDNVRQRGVSRMASLEVLLEKADPPLLRDTPFTDEEKNEWAARKNGYYVDSLSDISENDVLPGALDFIELMKQRGMLLAVGSASKNAPLILEKTGLSKYMDAIISGNEATRSKPDPQVFLLGAEKLGIAPFECLVVEDANAGIEAAKNGGMTALAVGAAQGCPIADYRTENLKTAKALISEIFG